MFVMVFELHLNFVIVHAQILDLRKSDFSFERAEKHKNNNFLNTDSLKKQSVSVSHSKC